VSAHCRAKETSGALGESFFSKSYTDPVCEVDVECGRNTAGGWEAGGGDTALEGCASSSVGAIRCLFRSVLIHLLRRFTFKFAFTLSAGTPLSGIATVSQKLEPASSVICSGNERWLWYVCSLVLSYLLLQCQRCKNALGFGLCHPRNCMDKHHGLSVCHIRTAMRQGRYFERIKCNGARRFKYLASA